LFAEYGNPAETQRSNCLFFPGQVNLAYCKKVIKVLFWHKKPQQYIFALQVQTSIEDASER
jgi:hypothetical protein